MKKAKTYIVLLRGVNVGGKNKVSMANLKKSLTELGFSDVTTYIVSGNVILKSTEQPATIQAKIEKILPMRFKLDSDLIKVLVLTHSQLKAVVDKKPKGFGDHPKKYYSDAIFMMGITVTKAMTAFNPREGIDQVWQGNKVIYSQRLTAKRTQSRLSAIVKSPLYKSMTIRSWNTTTKLLMMVNELDNA